MTLVPILVGAAIILVSGWFAARAWFNNSRPDFSWAGIVGLAGVRVIFLPARTLVTIILLIFGTWLVCCVAWSLLHPIGSTPNVPVVRTRPASEKPPTAR